MIKIKVSNLHKSFRNHKILQGVDLEVEEGSSLVILGGSGTGKSVLIKNIIGLMTPDYGTIEIDGEDTTHIVGKERLKIMEKCGFLFQGGALFDSLNVEDNITFFAERRNKLSKHEKRQLAIEKAKAVGLDTQVLSKYPAELSGGMQKRAALARAICINPQILFLDEPTTGVDPIMANVINDLIIKVRDELGATTVTITHDMNSAMQIATDVALIHEGKILWKGKKEEVSTSSNDYLHQFINGLTEGPIAVNV